MQIAYDSGLLSDPCELCSVQCGAVCSVPGRFFLHSSKRAPERWETSTSRIGAMANRYGLEEGESDTEGVIVECDVPHCAHAAQAVMLSAVGYVL